MAVAFKNPALFKPATSWEYSNTNYISAGLLVQKVTDRPVGEEITNRIIKKLHLRNTYCPAQGVQSIKGRHAQGYFSDQPGKPLTDVTNSDPSFAWAAGQLISTPSEVNRFFGALLSGKLLKPQQLAEMMKTVLAKDGSVRGDVRYGLGIQTFPLSCGRLAWSHGGDIPGIESRNAIRTDGRAATGVVTARPETVRRAGDLRRDSAALRRRGDRSAHQVPDRALRRYCVHVCVWRPQSRRDVRRVRRCRDLRP